MGGGCVACRIIVSAPVPVPFLWTLDLGPGFGTWIWDWTIRGLQKYHKQSGPFSLINASDRFNWLTHDLNGPIVRVWKIV